MTTATDKQLSYIATLTRQAGLGSLYSHGIKAVLGKNPVGGLTREKASEVIDALKARAAKRGRQ